MVDWDDGCPPSPGGLPRTNASYAGSFGAQGLMDTRSRPDGEEQTSSRTRHESSLNGRRVNNDDEKESSQQTRTD